MADKRKQKDKSMEVKINAGKSKKGIVVIGIAALTLIIAVWFLYFYRPYVRDAKSKATYEQQLGDGILILSTLPYSGQYVEDGSDSEVENVWSIVVQNTSDEDIQFLRIKGEYEGESAQFDITTLPANSTVKVLESTAKSFPEDAKGCSYTVENLAWFQEKRSLHQELFQISVHDNWIKVENHGSKDITNDIYVYYKNMEKDMFLGGITYRVKFEGGIKAGQSQEQQAMHFSENKSKIMFLTYE